VNDRYEIDPFFESGYVHAAAGHKALPDGLLPVERPEQRCFLSGFAAGRNAILRGQSFSLAEDWGAAKRDLGVRG